MAVATAHPAAAANSTATSPRQQCAGHRQPLDNYAQRTAITSAPEQSRQIESGTRQ